MIYHSVLVDVSSKILNGKDRSMYKRVIVVRIDPYNLASFINQVIFILSNN